MLCSLEMNGVPYPRVASFRSATALAEHLEQRLGWSLPYDDRILTAPSSPLAQSMEIPWRDGLRTAANRVAVQPMEGWDAELDGTPSDLTRRRWRHFGESGAALIWGGEAVAVLPEARANPHQLLLTDRTAPAIAALRAELVAAHRRCCGTTDGFLVGIQLTHSGRFSKPTAHPEPVSAYRHPILDLKFPAAAPREPVSDAEVGRVVQAFAVAARLGEKIGFDFVDLKHCHGYLGHEFLSAFHRPGPYGGSFDNRTRFLQELVAAVRASTSRLGIAVRLSAYDSVPYTPDPVSGRGVPVEHSKLIPYCWGFGVNPQDPCQPDLTEAKRLLDLLQSLDVRLVNITAGTPYYSPHLQRPALFPPCDAYDPPEDPLAGAARLLAAARELKAAAPGLVYVSSGWSYLQDYLPHFAQGAVRTGWTDFVGLGRLMLSYPQFPADVLKRGSLDRRRLCRTFSDCTNGPRNSLVSGCYPLDPFYQSRPEAAKLRAIKLQLQRSGRHQAAPGL